VGGDNEGGGVRGEQDEQDLVFNLYLVSRLDIANLGVDLVGTGGSSDYRAVVFGLADVETDYLFADVPGGYSEMRFYIYRENHSELASIVKLLVRPPLVPFCQQFCAHDCPLNRVNLLNQLHLVVLLHQRKLHNLILLYLLPQYQYIPFRRAN
jgi:hypothetical protein